MNWASLIPNLPDSYTSWDGVTTVALVAMFKLFRGTRMKQRSRYVDRMGWSIIIYDWVFGAIFLIATILTFYPGLWGGPWFDHLINTLLKGVTGWQFYETWRAPAPRVEAAISGAINGHDVSDPGPGQERRKALRREDDINKERELAAYRQGVHKMQGGI